MASSASEESATRPSPADFEEFIPWACYQSGVEAAIVVIRSDLEAYTSPYTKQVRKPTKAKTDITPTGSDVKENKTEVLLGIKGDSKVVNIESIYDSTGYLVQLKFLRNSMIPRTLLKIISLITPFYPHLTKFTINRGLTSAVLYELSKIVLQAKITEVVLDDTVILEANYYILLENNSPLKYLSLARCSLNDVAVDALVSRLQMSSLSILNLSSNRITDVGAIKIGTALRTNRKLTYLNLSGNMITDAGAECILNCLTEFALTQEETTEKKAKLLAYFKEKNELVMKNLNELRQAGNKKNVVDTKKWMKTIAPPIKKQKGLERAFSTKNLLDTPRSDAVWLENATIAAKASVEPFQNPFSPENTVSRNGIVYCLGNNILCYLNLAYNNLTYFTVKKLYEVVTAQDDMQRVPKGLVNICIEGNNIPESCFELTEIDYILQSRLATTRKESMMRKRPVKINLK